MLKISKLADYGTVIMGQLAKEDGLSNAKEIALKTHINVPTVSKILKVLAACKLVNSVRGVAGGYILAKSPNEISISDIIKALEGESGLTECAHSESHCALEMNCQVGQNWQKISSAIYQALASVRLSDLIDSEFKEQNIDVNAIRVLSKAKNTDLKKVMS